MLEEMIIGEPCKKQMFEQLSGIDFVGLFLDGDHLKQKISHAIVGTLKALLTRYAKRETCARALVLRNLPVDACIPATPFDSSAVVLGKVPITQLTLLSLAVNLGTPIGFSSENNGAIIHNISPMKDKKNTKSGQGAAEPLSMHSDFAFSDHRPDWLILMCLRNEDRIPTGICFVEQICQSLTPEELALLMSPSFFIFPPESSLLKEPRMDAILAQRGNELISRFNRDKCKGQTASAQAVLDKFAAIADELACEVVLTAGDVLIFDNKAVLHRRRSFEAKYDGTDRWLQRVYCKAKNTAKNIEAELIRDLAINGGV